MSKENDDTTDVVFRMYPRSQGGDCLALFPRLSMPSGLCMSYQSVGQHANADYNLCVRSTRPAKPHEYAELKRELESVGYRLRVVKRVI